MKFKTSVTLMVALVLGLVTAKVGLDVLKKYGGRTGAGTRIVVAKKDLHPGHVIGAADVAMEEVPARLAASAKTFRDADDTIGRTVVATIAVGFPVTETVLAPEGAGAGIQALVPPGYRAVTVDVSESSGVAGLLVPGCRVDVISTLRSGNDTIAKTIVENVKVQYVQRQASRTSRTASGSTISTGAETGPARTVTLLVRPKEAAAIELANAQGKPRLVLRGSADGTIGEDGMMSQRELLGLPDEEPVEIVAPPPPLTDAFGEMPDSAARGRRVEIIRGGVSSMMTYEDEARGKEDGAAPVAEKERSTGGESRTVSDTSSDPAPRTDAGRGNLRKGN